MAILGDSHILLVLPLIVLYFAIDRKKIFLMGFYGFSINVWLTFINDIGTRLGWWDFDFMVMPYTPSFFSINSSLVPVMYMLVYQWTLNHNKNYYFFSFLTAAFISFVLMPLLATLGFFHIHTGLGYFNVLLVNIGIFLISKLTVNAFSYRQKTKK